MATDTAPSSRPLGIFLSSTARDLPEHRKAVVGIIERLSHAPIQMETFGARTDLSLVECRRLAAEADAMVVVVAHRYGWVPTTEDGGDGEKSITWHEVEAAVLAAKPVFRYLCDDTAASPDHRDDDERLELFRQTLRRYPCDTFSTPDDLAKKVAVTLGEWSRRCVRDFAPAFEMIDLAGYHTQPSTLRASTFFQISLIRLVLQISVVSTVEIDREGLDQFVEGAYLSVAKSALAQHAQICAAQLSALTDRLSRAKAQEGEIRALMAELLAERPPERPKPPRSPDLDPLRVFYISENRAYEAEAYQRALAEYRKAEEKYEVSLTEYGKRQATIATQRLRLETAQQHVSQLEFDLSLLSNNCADEQRRLKIEVDIARDQDISALLAAMRDRGAQQLAEPSTLSQGFILLLATDLSSSFLSKYLSEASAALRVEQVGHDVSELVEAVVRRDHQGLGKDFLALFGPLQDGLAQGMEMTGKVRGVLAALPLDKLRDSCSESQNLMALVVPTVEAYDSLIDPDSIARASIAIDCRRTELGQAIGAVHTFFDKFATLHASVQDVRTRTALLLERLEEMAANCRPWLDDCKVAWAIVSRARQSQCLGADTKEFCAKLQAEAERRLGEPIEKLVARCESKDFGVKDAEAARSEHVATGVIEQSEALNRCIERRLTELEVRAAEFARAGKAIAALPRQQADAYRVKLRLVALITVIPVLNVLCASYADALVSDYDSAMRSNHSAYLGLGEWSLPWLRWASSVSATGGVLSVALLILIPNWGESGRGLPFVFVLSYVVSFALWLASTVRVLGIEKERQQNVRKRLAGRKGGSSRPRAGDGRAEPPPRRQRPRRPSKLSR